MSTQLKFESEYDEWMCNNYPGYSILDAFQAMKPYYATNSPLENDVSILPSLL